MERYENLSKIPAEPAARMLAMNNAKLRTPLQSPAKSMVDVVLAELEEKEAWVDILRLLAIALPARESVWWSCLAARDVVGHEKENATHCLKAAEAWVFKPNDETREAARLSLDNVYVDDDTSLCATAAMYADGTMGPGDLAQYPAPIGAVGATVFGMNMVALSNTDDFFGHIQLLIDRALDIARGGNGDVEKADAKEPETVGGDA